MTALFGPAGNAASFEAAGGDIVLKAPALAAAMGLDAYEYQGGHGIHISKQRAEKLAENARQSGVTLSVHSPYYISLSGKDEQKRENSVQYILQSARAAKWMGARRVVVHSGSCSGMAREEALLLSKGTLSRALQAMDAEGLTDISLCPETMGKLNQLGTLEEVAELCLIDERLIPCVDFGHLNARTLGGLKTAEDFQNIVDTMANKLGEWRAKHFHSHFSKIEFTQNGEKRHLTFEDTVFGPEFGPLAEIVAKQRLCPVFICESSGTQAEDAAEMKKIYNRFLRENKKTAKENCDL